VIDVALLYIVHWFSRVSKTEKDWKHADMFAAKVVVGLKEKNIPSAPESKEEVVSEEKVVLDESKPEVDEKTIKTSGSKWWIIVFVLLLGAVGYWLLMMGGLELLLGLFGELTP